MKIEKRAFEVALNGKLNTADDPSLIARDFQAMTNLRYGNKNPRGVGGMTKINTTALSNHPKIRNMFHLNKDYPVSESHLLAQAFNSGGTESKVYDNTTAIPGQGDFSVTTLYTDASGAGTGRFSPAPQGSVAYCNGKNALIWGGNEMRCAGFINYHPSGDFKYDFTDLVANDKTDSDNVATLTKADGTVDANTMLLLHLDNSVTDSSPTTPHTMTNTNVTFSSSTYKFGTHSAYFNGTNARLSTADNADFDFSGGSFTIDFHVYPDSGQSGYLYYQKTDASNYIYLQHVAGSTASFKFEIYSGGASVVELTGGSVAYGSWMHVEIVEDGDTWYMMVNGTIVDSDTDTDRAANYTGTVYIGDDGAGGNYFKGYIDEYRISDTARHTSNFEVQVTPYGSDMCYLYIGGTRPLKGIKFYVGTANTASGVMSIDEWDGSEWSAVTNLSDGTASGGVALAQTGTASFDSTATTSKVKAVEQVLVYFYRVTIPDCDNTTTITQVTLDAPFQLVKDIWDGEFRSITNFLFYDASAGVFRDFSTNVSDEDYNSGNTGTYADVSSMATSDYILVGSDEKLSGVNFTFAGSFLNVTGNALMSVSYWNGSAWTSVGTVDDGTVQAGRSFSGTGLVTWTPPSDEQKRDIKYSVKYGYGWYSSSFVKRLSLPVYFYKIHFSSVLSTNIRIDRAEAVPKQTKFSDRNWTFPFYAQNRLWLCEENNAICSAENSPDVFNGNDSTTREFGNEAPLTAGTWLYSQMGSNIYDVILFLKRNETWILVGSGIEEWTKYQISDKIGCIAPLTLASTQVDFETSAFSNRNIAIWQGENGIYIFSGRSITPIHGDIEDIFRDNTINRTYIASSTGWVDPVKMEYHWCFASGSSTTLNEEYVYDLRRNRWFTIDRGTGKYLQVGIAVKDTSGNQYTYGGINTGYVERLENGTDFDGNDIAHDLWTGDIALLDGSIMYETQVRRVKHVMKTKTTTTSTVTLTHYGDGSTTGTALNATVFDPTKAGYRIADTTESTAPAPHIFHSFRMQISTNDESIGYEPLFIGGYYQIIREDR